MQGTYVAPMCWDDVRLFLALSRSRTVSRAAGALGVDASTVSRRLAALEATLATTLFERSRDGITKTKAAEDLLAVAEEIESAMFRFENAADRLEREVTGVVRLACPSDVADVIVAPLVGSLVERHPGLRIEIHAGEATVDLSRREADLALRVVRPRGGDLVVTRLRRARWVLAAAPENARAPLRRWSDVPWVTWGERMAHVGAARWLAKHVREADPVVRSDSLRVQISVVAAGVGAALFPQPSLAHYGLVPLKIGAALAPAADEWPADELYLVTHRALRNVPRVRAVWELLVARLAEKGGAATVFGRPRQ